MARTSVRLLLGAILVLGWTASAADRASPVQAGRQAAGQVVSSIAVTLPQEDAELLIDDRVVAGSGTTRTVDTAPLRAGQTYRYTFTARWQPNTYTTMTRSRVVSVRAGNRVVVDLSAEAPTDRVRVIYVPTPDDIADQMVRLAGVGPSDVVIEPGCGDARITIAAVRAGARRGVGIDIDPDRVEDSRAKVKAAGLADRIEIRLGDALEIPDLSSATVVFLYMGDHFNMLIRPLLWKALPVGARVVSHRFEMGDWTPDRTVEVRGDDGIEYELHLWTITPEIKRRGRG
jgi:uncharacterized protein (TIGR03000 family)